MIPLVFSDVSRFWANDLWYALPAIVAVSLVYAATRHERMRPILAHAARMGFMIVTAMFVVFVVLQVLSWCA